MTAPATDKTHTLVEQRVDSALLLALVQTVHDDVKSFHTSLSALDARLTKHMTDETMELAQEITKLMADAFPEGDPKGHRKLHEAAIEKAMARAEFWKKMTFEICKGGLLGFAVWALLSLWNTFLQGPHK